MVSKKSNIKSKKTGSRAKAKKEALIVCEPVVCEVPALVKVSENVASKSITDIALGDLKVAPELANEMTNIQNKNAEKHLSFVEERARAREARTRMRQASKQSVQQSIQEVKKQVVPQTTSLPVSTTQNVQVTTPNNGHVNLELSDAYKYRLLYLEAQFKQVSEPIRQRLKQAAQAKLLEDIKSAVSCDSTCHALQEQIDVCVKELIASLTIPDGYTPVFVATADGIVVCKPITEQTGKRM